MTNRAKGWQRRYHEEVDDGPVAPPRRGTPGKRSRAARDYRHVRPPPVADAAGVLGVAQPYPFRSGIERSFGGHSLDGVRAYIGGAAADAADALGADAFARGNEVVFREAPDLHTAAHEATHIIQQRAGVSVPAGTGSTDDVYEHHADAVADLVVRGESAEALLAQLPGSGSSHAVVQRAAKGRRRSLKAFKPNPSDYIETWSNFIPTLQSLLAPLPLPLPPYASWVAGSNFLVYELVRQLVRYKGRHRLATAIQLAIKPVSLALLVDRYGAETTDQRRAQFALASRINAHDIEQLLPGVMDVTAGIAGALHAKLVAAVRRMIPAYASARLHRYERADAEDLPNARFDDLPQIHPIDYFLAKTLTAREYVAIDRKAFVAAGGKAKVDSVNTKNLTVSAVPGMPGWYKASRKDATISEVAKVLLGSSIRANELCAMPPYFAPRAELSLDYAVKAPDRKRAAEDRARLDGLRWVLGREALPKLDQRPVEVEQALLRSDRADDIVLAQVGNLDAGTSVDRAATLEYLHRCRRQLHIAETMAARFGEARRLKVAITRIESRIARLASAPDTLVARWGSVAKRQTAILFEAASGLEAAGAHLVQNGVVQPFSELPKATREPLTNLVVAYARAAATSELFAVAARHLAQARRLKAAAAADSVDALLTDTLQSQQDVRGVDVRMSSAGDSMNHGALANRRRDLRRETLQLRAGLLVGDKRSAGKAAWLAERAEIVQAESRVAMLVAKLRALDGVVGQLQAKHIANTFTRSNDMLNRLSFRVSDYISGFSHILSNLATAKGALRDARQLPQHNALDRADFEADHKSAREKFQRARKAFVTYVNDQNVAGFLRKAAGKIDHVLLRHMIFDVVSIVGVTITSMGVGAAADGFFVGALGSEFVGAVAGMAAESVSFSLLDRAAFGSGDVADDLVSNAMTNVVQFGLLRAFGGLFQAGTKLGNVGAKLTDEAATLAARALGGGVKLVELAGKGVIAAGVMFAQMQAQQKRETGKFMGLDDLEAAALQGVAVMLAAAVASRSMARIRGLAQVHGARARFAVKWRRVNRLAHSVLSTRGQDTATVRALLAAERELLHAEIEHYHRLANDPKALEQARLNEHQVDKLRHSAEQRAGQLDSLDTVMTQLEPISAHEMATDTELLPELRNRYEAMGAKPSAIETEPETRIPFFWIKAPDGSAIKIRGRKPFKNRTLIGLYGHDFKLRDHAQYIEPLPGTLDVVIHGTVDHLEVKLNGEFVAVSHRTLATFIKKSGRAFQRIRLLSCESGKHARGTAQHLANKLGVEVLAPGETAFVGPMGELTVGPADNRPTRNWVTFHPKKSGWRFTPFTGEEQPLHAQHENQSARRAAAVLAKVEVRRNVETGNYEVTAAQGRRMRLLFERIEGVATLDYGHGFSVHYEGQDWFFHFVDKHERTTPVLGHGMNKLGLPEANVSVVTYHGFQGLKKVNGVPWKELPPAERKRVEEWFEKHPLLHFGHVGISFDGGKTILGFSPKDAPPGDPKAAEELMRKVRNNEPVPGEVKNDRKVFDAAAAMVKHHGWDTAITTSAASYSAETKHDAHTRTVDMMNNPNHGKQYQFPYREPDEHGNHYANENARNCATFPELVGLCVPEPTGLLGNYMPKLKEWAAQSPVKPGGDQ